jgi:hypothetical protein
MVVFPSAFWFVLCLFLVRAVFREIRGAVNNASPFKSSHVVVLRDAVEPFRYSNHHTQSLLPPRCQDE